MNRNTVFSIGVVTVLGLALAGCHSESVANTSTANAEDGLRSTRQNDGQEGLALKPEDVPGMTYVEVKKIDLPGVLETTGQVTFDDRRVSTIVSRVVGRIENIKVSVWDTVQRGQLIAELYSPDFMTAEAEYLQARSTAKVSTASGPDDSGDLAAAMVEAGKRKLELLGMEDKDIAAIRAPSPTIWMRAPISGTVTQNLALIGSAISPGTVLYSLTTLDQVWITADIYEVDLARVQAGQEMEAVTTAFPQDVFKGRILRVSPAIDPNAHTAQIRCEVQNPGLKLKPQMLARVRIITSPGSALVVPQEALVFDGDSYFAFVEEAPGELMRRQVTIGAWNDQGYARVVSGLNAGERIVAKKSLQVDALWHAARGETF